MLDIHTHIFITLVYVIKSPKIKLSQYDRANFYCPAVSYCRNYKVIILSLHHKKGQREDRTGLGMANRVRNKARVKVMRDR